MSFHLHAAERLAIARRTVSEAVADQVTDSAAALAYYAFLAIPSLLLLAIGVLGLAGGPDAVETISDRLAAVMPAEAVTLVRDSLTRIAADRGGSLALTVVGGGLAVWTASSAMTALTRAFNRAYGVVETRGFLRLRSTALAMLALTFGALALVVGLLVLGPHVSRWVGDATGLEGLVGWLWWTAQWPILVVGLLAAFALLLRLGPNVDQARWRLVTPGALLAVGLWLTASGLFAVYTSMFGSYNKTWGTLAGVVATLVWLWLSGLALLVGAELNAVRQARRSTSG